MAKLPWLMFFTRDWLTDPAVSALSSASRGIWIDLLCVMHASDCAGTLRGTTDSLARSARCSPVELVQALSEFKTHKTADVTDRNGEITLVSRRMKREAEKAEHVRKGNCERKQRERATKKLKASPALSRDSHAPVTGDISDVRVTPPNPQRGNGGGRKLTPGEEVLRLLENQP